MYREMGMTYWLEKAETERTLIQGGRPPSGCPTLRLLTHCRPRAIVVRPERPGPRGVDDEMSPVPARDAVRR
jgi:hypothetical protein